MSIRPDSWIKRQCTPPSFMVTEDQPLHTGNLTHQIRRITYPSHETLDSLKAKMEQYSFTNSGIKEFRPLTPEEIAAFKPMIEPFEPLQVRFRDKYLGFDQADDPNSLGEEIIVSDKVISYGVSSYGYDIRCADEFKVFTNINSTVVDPKNFNDDCFVNVSGKGYCIIPPNSFALARTVEYFRIPRSVLTICLGKSTYARVGIVVNVTPFEPEFEGQVVLEFSNTTPLPAKIYANEGCAQVLFFESDTPCDVSYKDRGGKYQGQRGITTAKL